MSEVKELDIHDKGVITDNDSNNYHVLARKYRPMVFKDLIGQEVLVTTLKNSFAKGRIAHAFLLHGVRGVGKTTAARIIGRGLNCSAQEKPTSEPCGICDNCTSAISERHMDIIEIDAASHTGVDDVRSLTDGVAYKPVLGRYRVYIIDEVHMLSISAFNALLKTLEEPPQHVKFIFCTTELKKIPVTVLSRCQRYDLKMVKTDDLINFFRGIVLKENMSIDEEALVLISRASGGSVRDGLSILDQAMGNVGEKKSISADTINSLLGLADRENILNLFDSIMDGEIALSLSILESIFEIGAEPMAVLEELLSIIHLISRLKIESSKPAHYPLSEVEYGRCLELSKNLTMSLLGRSWQILYRGMSEIRDIPNNREALEMVLIRLSYVSDLPDPSKLLEKLKDQNTSETKVEFEKPKDLMSNEIESNIPSALSSEKKEDKNISLHQIPDLEKNNITFSVPDDFKLFVSWLRSRKEMQLHTDLYERVQVAFYKPGHIELRKEDFIDEKFCILLKNRLVKATNISWSITVSEGSALQTLLEQKNDNDDEAMKNAKKNAKVKEILESFPGSMVKEVRSKT